MTEENDTGKHEYNFFLDKQIQQKLLEADEVIAAKETTLYKNPSTFSKVQGTGQSVQNSGANSNSSSAFGSQKINQVRSNSNKEKDIPRANISGWCVGPGVVYRKAESELPTRTRGQGFRDAYSRDSKVRPHTHNPQDFVFRHYADPRRYIEQYRKEHTCYDTTTTSATRNEFLETRRFYAYNQYSPLAVGSQNNIPHVNSPLPSAYQESAVVTAEQSFYNHKKQQATPTLQYTNRRDQAKQTINASLRQNTLHSRPAKPGMTASENVMTPEPLHDSGVIFDNDIKRAGSARGRGSPGVNGVSIQKGLTSIPTDLDRLSARAHQTQPTGVHVPLDPSIPNQFLGRKLGQVTNMSGQSRTVDSLAYQAGEIGGKQMSEVEATEEQMNLCDITDSHNQSPSERPKSHVSDSHSKTHCQNGHDVLASNASLKTSREERILDALSPRPLQHVADTIGHNDSEVKRMRETVLKTNSDGGRVSSSSFLPAVKPATTQSLGQLKGERADAKLKDGRTSTRPASGTSFGGDSCTSAVSIDQLSTTPLGADVTIKSRPQTQPQLEASRTYHIFPAETLVKDSTGAIDPPQLQLWNPGKSSAVVLNRLRGFSNGTTAQLFDPGLGSPFKTSPRPPHHHQYQQLQRPRTEESGCRSSVEFITREITPSLVVRDSGRHTVNLCPDTRNRGGVSGNSASNCNGNAVSTGLKANTITPDLPSNFQLKGVSTQPRLLPGGGAGGTMTRRRRGQSKTAGAGRYSHHKKDVGHAGGMQLESTNNRGSWSASTTDTNASSSAGGRGNGPNGIVRKKSQAAGLDIAPTGSSNRHGGGGVTPPSLGPVPYFKFWNSSIPPKSREGRRGGGSRRGDHRNTELNLTQLAQLVLADEVGKQDRGLADAAQKVLEEKRRLELLQHSGMGQEDGSSQPVQGSIATGISGDPPTASSGAAVDSVWCPEARLEQLRLVNRRLLLAPPAPHAPQLTFIKEGQEGEFLEVESNHFVPGWREKNSSCAKDKKCKGSRAELMPGSSCSLTVVPHFYCGDVITDTGDGSSSSNASSLRPNGGSSEKTSLSSHHSGSSGKSNNNIINHKSAIKVKSVDHAVSKDKMCQPGDDDTTKQSNVSLTSVPSPSVYDRLIGSQVSRLSWREKVKHQQQTSITSSGDASFGNEVVTSNRWALARREEELSSIAHARRIKHLIEQSRLRAGGHGVRGGFTFGRSFSDGGEERETESSMGGLKVEGLQQNKTQYNKKSRVPLATVTNGAQASSDLGFADMKNMAVQSIARVNKTKRTKNMTNDDIHKGDHLQLGDDTQFALPPVGKTHDKKSKDSPSDAPILGDLLDTQAFFSHGIPLNPAVAVGKKSHVHSSVPSDKNLPTKSNANNSSNASRNIAATIPASIDAVAVIGAQKHPKLKYSSSLSHKLTGGCSP